MPVSWPEALDRVAAELRRVYAAHGPRAVFGGSYGWASAGRFHDAQHQLHRFLNLAGGYVRSVNSYSSGAATVILPHVIGPQGAVAGNNVSWDELVAESALVLAFGGMALKNNDVGGGGTSRHIARDRLRAARERGVEFHLIGPLRDDLPADVEAVWHPIRPGTDVALMLGLAHTLVSRGPARPRISRPVLRRLGECSRPICSGRSDGQPKDAGLGRRDLRHAGRRDHRAGAPHRRPAHAGHLLDVAAARRARRAAGVDGGRAGGDARPDRAAGRRLRLCAGGDLEHRQAAAGGAAADHADRPQQHRRFHPGGAHRRHAAASRRAVRLQRPASDLSGHPAGLLGRRQPVPPSSGSRPAAPRLLPRPTRSSCTSLVWTATARHADIVLPATITLEREDIGAAAGDPLLVAMHRAVAPYGEARDDHAIFAGLAERLGFGDAFTEGRSPRQWLEHLYEPTRRALAERGINAPDFAEFWEEGELVLPTVPWDGGIVRAFRRDPEARAPADAERQDRDRLGDDRRLRLCRLPRPPDLAAAGEGAGSPAAARFPLQLSPTSRRPGCTASSISAPPAWPRRSTGASRCASIRMTPPRAASPTATSCASTTIAAPASPARC